MQLIKCTQRAPYLLASRARGVFSVCELLIRVKQYKISAASTEHHYCIWTDGPCDGPLTNFGAFFHLFLPLLRLWRAPVFTIEQSAFEVAVFTRLSVSSPFSPRLVIYFLILVCSIIRAITSFKLVTAQRKEANCTKASASLIITFVSR